MVSSCQLLADFLLKRADCRQFRAMAKSKTVWEWKGKTFETKAKLLKYLRERARQVIEQPSVEERLGKNVQFHDVQIKIQVSLRPAPLWRRKKSAGFSFLT
jgi:hypothetical protein